VLQSEAVARAEVQFEKRLAAKMLDMIEQNKTRVRDAVAQAQKEVRRPVCRFRERVHMGTVDKRRVIDAHVLVSLQAEALHTAAAEEVKIETEKLVSTYELALQDLEKERDEYGRRMDHMATDAVVHLAKIERLELQTNELRRTNTMARLRYARLWCRAVSVVVQARARAEAQGVAMRSERARLEASHHRLTTMKTAIEECLQANREEILTEVRHQPTGLYEHETVACRANT
jgi:hypothetical protein